MRKTHVFVACYCCCYACYCCCYASYLLLLHVIVVVTHVIVVITHVTYCCCMLLLLLRMLRIVVACYCCCYACYVLLLHVVTHVTYCCCMLLLLLRMLLLLHALIPCVAAYILLYFLAMLSLHPSTLNGNVFTLIAEYIIYACTMELYICVTVPCLTLVLVGARGASDRNSLPSQIIIVQCCQYNTLANFTENSLCMVHDYYSLYINGHHQLHCELEVPSLTSCRVQMAYGRINFSSGCIQYSPLPVSALLITTRPTGLTRF